MNVTDPTGESWTCFWAVVAQAVTCAGAVIACSASLAAPPAVSLCVLGLIGCVGATGAALLVCSDDTPEQIEELKKEPEEQQKKIDDLQQKLNELQEQQKNEECEESDTLTYEPVSPTWPKPQPGPLSPHYPYHPAKPLFPPKPLNPQDHFLRPSSRPDLYHSAEHKGATQPV